jgi:peptidoglycan/xylan/chitin deacetylase (PgdA/CDA1 family)
MIHGVRPDELRSAALLLWPGDGAERDGADSAALRPFRATGAPSLPVRICQALAAERGWIGWDSRVVAPLMEMRRAALGDAAGGAPRVLIRVDEFPHARAFDSSGPFGTEAFERFHAVLAEAGVPYLLAVTPRVSREYLDPGVEEWRALDAGEVAKLAQLKDDGVAFGLHGLDHRTRHSSPRRHSELCGLDAEATAARIDTARATLDALAIEAPVFVPPFNRFDASQYPLLAERFEVVCGGPESVRLIGFPPTPAWDGDAVYLPSYPPLYGHAAEIAPEIERMIDAEQALWAPVTLHWGWELEDDFAGLRRLCDRLAGCASEWGRFLEAVRESRAAA